MLQKILGVVFTLFFVFAAVVQFNDPDAWMWIILYLLAAAASILFFLGRLKRVNALVLAILFIGFGIYHWPAEFEGVALKDGMKTMNIELGRESLGMGIAALVMLLYLLLLKKRGKG